MSDSSSLLFLSILLLAALPVTLVLLLARLGPPAENRRSPALLLAAGSLWAISLYLLFDGAVHGKMALLCLLVPGYFSYRLFFRQTLRRDEVPAGR